MEDVRAEVGSHASAFDCRTSSTGSRVEKDKCDILIRGQYASNAAVGLMGD